MQIRGTPRLADLAKAAAGRMLALSRSAADATPGAKRDQSCQTEPAAHPAAAEGGGAEGGGAEGGGREGAVASAKHHGAPSWRRASRRVSLAQQAVARADKAVARCQRVSVVHGSSDELCAQGLQLELLDLDCTKITDAGCAALAAALDGGALPALEELHLYGIPAGAEAQAAVYEARANLRGADNGY